MSQVFTRHHFDVSERKFYAERVQDVEPIIEHNKALQTTPQKSEWGRHVAKIPNIFIDKWLHEEWARGNTTIKMFDKEFDALVERKLKDPDYRFLRTDK